MFPIWDFGSEEQKQQWLPGMAAGEAIGCFGLTEPDFGSDPANMRTTAKRDGDDGPQRHEDLDHQRRIAHVAVVWAKLDGKIRGFLVPTDTKGFTAPDIHGKFSLRA